MAMFHKFDCGKPLMSRDAAIRLMKTAMADLTAKACDGGWQTGLLSFVQEQHGKPTGTAIKMIIEDHYKIDEILAKADEHGAIGKKVKQIAERRELLKAELLAPVEMRMAG